MEEHNEYGNCWEDLVKRLDAEDRVANAIMARWTEEEECCEERREGRMGSVTRYEKNQEGKKKTTKRRLLKDKTGEELRKMIVDKENDQEVKKTKREGRKMVREGKMKTMDSFFSRK